MIGWVMQISYRRMVIRSDVDRLQRQIDGLERINKGMDDGVCVTAEPASKDNANGWGHAQPLSYW